MVVRIEPTREQLDQWTRDAYELLYADSDATFTLPAADFVHLLSLLGRVTQDVEWYRERAQTMNKELDPYGDRMLLARAVEA